MSLIPSFSVTNNILNTSQFQLADTSGGGDGFITGFIVTMYLADNTVFYTNKYSWPLTTNPITISALDKDYAFNILCQWVDINGNVLYSASQIVCFTGFLEFFFYSLTQTLAAQQNYANDSNWYTNYTTLRILIDSANQALNIGQSVFNAEACLLRAQNLYNNQSKFF